jgi:hypothetical protein
MKALEVGARTLLAMTNPSTLREMASGAIPLVSKKD